jgi:hypothetical protein
VNFLEQTRDRNARDGALVAPALAQLLPEGGLMDVDYRLALDGSLGGTPTDFEEEFCFAHWCFFLLLSAD